MQTLIHPEIEGRSDLKTAIDRATELLAEEMGGSAATAKVEWTLKQDPRGRELLELRVSDWTGSVGYRFAPTELESRNHMQYRLHRLWGDLLMVRSHVQMDGHLGPYQGCEGW